MQTRNLLILIAVIILAAAAVLYRVHVAERNILEYMRGADAEFDTQAQAEAERLDAMIDRIAFYLSKKTGSLWSREVAMACVMRGRDPYLLAAIASKEGANPFAWGGNGEYGAWQVTAKHWGHVPADTFAQAKQAQYVIDHLLRQNDGKLFKALYRYNGHGSDAIAYAKDVLRRYEELKRG